MKIYWDKSTNSKNIIGSRVKELRHSLNLSQRALAEKLQLAGYEFNDLTILRIEQGSRFVPDYEVVALADFFDVSYDYFLGGGKINIRIKNCRSDEIIKQVMNGMKREYLFFVIDIVLTVLGIYMIIQRSLLGIDFTDQSWYVAEPYMIAEGAVPYVNNWTQVPGFTIPLAIFTLFYIHINGGTEGIFLFSRIEYIVWLAFIGIISLYLLNRGKEKRIPVSILIPFLLGTPHQLFSIDYNTIGPVYLLLICVILLSGYFYAEVKWDFIKGFISGIIMARAVIGTPYILLPCAVLVLFMCFTKRWKMICGYSAGGVLTAFLVLGWCGMKGGFRKLLDGLHYWLTDSAYFKMENEISVLNNCEELYYFFSFFVICLFIVYTLKSVLHLQKKAFEKLLFAILTGCFVMGLVQFTYTHDFKMTVYWCWFEPVILYLFLPDSRRRRTMGLLSLTVLLYGSAFVFSSLFNNIGFGGREYWLYIPTLVSMAALFGWNPVMHIKNCFRIGTIILSLVMLLASYRYMYRDERAEKLTCMVESGVWKGLYTTEERAEEIVELEQYIRSVTQEDQKILFMDWASFGYLMSNGKACSPSSYDNMCYSYEVDDPRIMYDYFSQTGQVPDKIIYIDFGRDSALSIENDWRFNEFVNANYEYSDGVEYSLFRVLVYDLTDAEQAIKMVMELCH